MKQASKHTRLALAVALGALVALPTAFAQVGADPKTNGRHSRIVGIWDVDVAVGPCGQPGGQTFKAMHKYEFGGTGQVVPATNPSALSAHLVVWEHTGGNNYRAAIKFYRYDANGVATGYNVITNDVTISKDGTQYAGAGVAKVYNMAGTLLAQVCPEFAGTRFSG